MDYENSPELIAIYPILKRERDRTHTFAMNLEKTLYKKANPFLKRLGKWAINMVLPFRSIKAAYRPNSNELNMFLVADIRFDPQVTLDLEDRIEIEKILSKKYQKYARSVVKLIKKEARSDTELIISRKIFREFAKIYQLPEIREVADTDFEQVVNSFSFKYEEIVKSSAAFLWDFPGGEEDRIATQQAVIGELYDDTSDSIERSVSEIADELALLVFSVKYLEHLTPILEKSHNYLKQFIDCVDEAKNNFTSFQTEKQKEITIEFFSVILGKILGAREFLNITLRQVERLRTIGREFKDEAKKMGSSKLANLADEFSSDEQTGKTLNFITELIENNTSFIEPLRDFNAYLVNAPIDSTKNQEQIIDMITYFINSYHIIEELRFLSDQFGDIQHFTSLTGDVAFEQDKGKQYFIPDDTVLSARDLFKTYELARSTIYALRGVDLDIKKGEFVAITGSSGSGKTTLINLLSGLDKPDRGAVFIGKQNLMYLSDRKLTDLRRKEIGFIFQFYNLISFLKSRENVALPAQLDGKRAGSIKRADKLLKDVGLEQFKKQYPNLLSGGQMQRVTIARALMNVPSIIFADEPTGDLDSITGEAIIELMEEFHAQGSTIVLVTHDPVIAARAQREIKIKDGQIEADINLSD
ncbi:MAG: ABC transporter ATP-binding protein [Candidatus Kariarchaeaceae archaeon]